MTLKQIKALEIGQEIELKLIADGRGTSFKRFPKGKITFKNNFYMTLQLKNYRESFCYCDFGNAIASIRLC